MSDIMDSYKELNNKFNAVNGLNELISKEENLEEDDKSIEFLASFYDNAKVEVQNVGEKIKSIEAEYFKLVKFFGDNPKDLSMETFIEIFNKFYKDLNVKKIYFLIILDC